MKRTNRDVLYAFCREFTGSHENGQIMMAAFIAECIPVIPGADPANLDREISEEDYQAQVVEIRQDTPGFRRSLLRFRPRAEVVQFWENQTWKNRNN